MGEVYKMTIAGCERELPICPISDTLDIAGFVMFGDVEITEKTAKALMEKLGYAPQALKRGGIVGILAKAEQAGMAKLAAELGVGEMTLRDIASELEKPGRDPRDELPAPVLRTDVLSMEDLKPGMELTGTVRNVIDFGAFVDIGVHQDGLVHISRMADRFIRHPSEVVRVGDVVTVWVVDVDVKKQRIALSMVKGRA